MSAKNGLSGMFENSAKQSHNFRIRLVHESCKSFSPVWILHKVRDSRQSLSSPLCEHWRCILWARFASKKLFLY